MSIPDEFEIHFLQIKQQTGFQILFKIRQQSPAKLLIVQINVDIFLFIDYIYTIVN